MSHQRGYALNTTDPAYNTVMNLGNMAIEGNVLPPQWLKHLKFDNGKPYTIAAILLSDVVYWYRPIWPRDEITGQSLPPRKKFASDKIQRSYDAYVEMYGFTKRQITDAFHYLEKQGLVDLDFRTINTEKTKLGNVLFIGLNTKRLAEITNTVPNKPEIPYHATAGEGSRYNVIGITPERETNTKTTTEITTETRVRSKKDFLDDAFHLQGQTSERTGDNPDDQWFNHRDKALKAFKGDMGRTPEERQAKKDAILGFVADTPDFDPEHWEDIIDDAITHGVGANNIARFIEAYPFKNYDAYLAHKYPTGRSPANGHGSTTDHQPAIRTEDGGYYV